MNKTKRLILSDSDLYNLKTFYYERIAKIKSQEELSSGNIRLGMSNPGWSDGRSEPIIRNNPYDYIPDASFYPVHLSIVPRPYNYTDDKSVVLICVFPFGLMQEALSRFGVDLKMKPQDFPCFVHKEGECPFHGTHGIPETIRLGIGRERDLEAGEMVFEKILNTYKEGLGEFRSEWKRIKRKYFRKSFVSAS